MSEQQWKQELWAFFESRSREVRSSKLSVEELCYISGKEPRLWTDEALFTDLVRSLREQLDLQPTHTLLELGCAAGFLARGLAPLVGRFIGVDLSVAACVVARKLELPRASFIVADGGALALPDASVDRVICHDVFTNLPDWSTANALVREMMRVVKPGGLVMVGSVPDDATKDAYQQRVYEVVKDLDTRFGPAVPLLEKRNLLARIRDRIWPVEKTNVQPKITCYYFKKSDFEQAGRDLHASWQIHEIHDRNPYKGFRYNVVYQRAS